MTQEYPKALYHPDTKEMTLVLDETQEADALIAWGIKKPEAEEGEPASEPAVEPAAEPAAETANEFNV